MLSHDLDIVVDMESIYFAVNDLDEIYSVVTPSQARSGNTCSLCPNHRGPFPVDQSLSDTKIESSPSPVIEGKEVPYLVKPF